MPYPIWSQAMRVSDSHDEIKLARAGCKQSACNSEYQIFCHHRAMGLTNTFEWLITDLLRMVLDLFIKVNVNPLLLLLAWVLFLFAFCFPPCNSEQIFSSSPLCDAPLSLLRTSSTFLYPSPLRCPYPGLIVKVWLSRYLHYWRDS
jgi:hypothetical protein